jgi:hypothetical protein
MTPLVAAPEAGRRAGARGSKTSLALGNLRAVVILIVIGFHSVLAYLGSQPAVQAPFDLPPYSWRAIPILDHERWFGFDLFCAFQYVFLMPFMFFLSGLFVWPSLARKGTWTFLSDRCLRLGIPFLLGVYLLMPIAHYPVYRVTASDPSWSAFWVHWTALPFSPSGPLWFLWHLIAFNLVAVAAKVLAPRWTEALGGLSDTSPAKSFLALLLVSTLAYVPLAHFYPPWDLAQYGPFAYQPGRWLHYAVYFLAGLVVGSRGLDHGILNADGPLAQRWLSWTAGAMAAFMLWLIMTALTMQKSIGAIPGLGTMADVAFALSSATACFAFAAIFLRFAVRPWRGFDSLSANAYGIYLIHYVFVIWLQYLLLGAPLFAVAKGVIVFTGTLVASWVVVTAWALVPAAARLMRAQRHRAEGAS